MALPCACGTRVFHDSICPGDLQDLVETRWSPVNEALSPYNPARRKFGVSDDGELRGLQQNPAEDIVWSRC